MDNKKEKELLKEIYINYRDYIYNLSYRYLKEKSASEDAVHETVLKIREKIKRKEITECHKLGKLIVYIVRSVCINKIKRDQKVIYREIFSSEIGVEVNYTDNYDIKVFLNDAINKLPVEQRKVLILTFLENLTYKEISERLNISEANVRKRIERARKILKKLWGGDEYEGK